MSRGGVGSFCVSISHAAHWDWAPVCVCGHLMGNVKAPACLSCLLYSSVVCYRMLHRIIVAQLLTRHSSLTNYKLEALGDRKIADPTKFLQLALTQL